ncbi:MAG: hypothetical protein AAFY57_18345 [Cyanobacteria bacterium J06642_2]
MSYVAIVDVIRGTWAALGVVYRQGYRDAKAGVVMMDLTPDDTVQTLWFAAPDGDRARRLMETIDRVN